MPRTLLACHYDASLFLCSATGSQGSEWVFLDELTHHAGVPANFVELVSDITSMMLESARDAQALRAQGMLGHQKAILQQLDELAKKRDQCLSAWIAPEAVRREHLQLSATSRSPEHARTQRWDAKAIAFQLHSAHCSIVDDFTADTVALRALLLSMRQEGTLMPGEIASGHRKATRGDLMCWVDTRLGSQPAPLVSLLAMIDELVDALASDPLLADDLGNGRCLVRHEMQTTCYPGNGVRPTSRHSDTCRARWRYVLLLRNAVLPRAGELGGGHAC